MAIARVESWEELPPFPARAGKPIPNQMRDVADFVARWEDPAPAARRVLDLRSSDRGNLNQTGEPGKRSAPALTPADRVRVDGQVPSDWTAGLEVGVRELVPAMIKKYGCVTVSSCAGHDFSGLAIESQPRSVQIVARDPEEADRLAQGLSRDLAEYPDRHPAIALTLTKRRLESAADNTVWPSINLTFTRRNGQEWNSYFDQIESATDDVMALVRGGRELQRPQTVLDLVRSVGAHLSSIMKPGQDLPSARPRHTTERGPVNQHRLGAWGRVDVPDKSLEKGLGR